MGLVERAFRGVDTVRHGLNDWFAQPAAHYCRLETREDDKILIADDGSMLSVIELFGSLGMIGAQEHSMIVKNIVSSISSRFSTTGHSIQIVMTYDPEGAVAEVHDALLPSKTTAKNLGLNIDSIMDDWEKSVARYCSVEHVFIVAWTRPFVLPPSEIKVARKKMGQNFIKSPNGSKIQDTGKIMTDIKDIHSGFVSQLEDAFTNNNMIIKTLDCHQALWWVRHEIDPAFTSRAWRPVLPGDKLPLKIPDQGGNADDVSEFFYPSLKQQVFPREAENVGRNMIRVGDHIHAPLSMVLPPQTPKPFNVLFRTLISKQMPWRLSFLFDGDGLSSTTLKSALASVLSFTSTANKKLNRVLDGLREEELKGVTLLRFQANFDTWVKDSHDAECLKLIRQRSAELTSAIQAWGTADCGEITGDPLLGLSATIPALMPASPAPASVAPIKKVLHMMPFDRPASPWRAGSIMLRTPDGKIMPYSQGSSLQAAWIDVGFAPMGSGKSVWLNTMNWGFLTQPGLSRLPWLSIIDVGPSSSGLISLIQAILPEDKKYLAAYHRLRMSPEHAINPFDTPLGCRQPFPGHVSFLVNLLSLFGTPLDKEAPQDGIPGIARLAIKSAYEELSDDRNPKIYNPGLDPKVDIYVNELGLHIDHGTSWWEIVDALFEKGYTHEAIRAQRYAVPILGDVAGMMKSEIISSQYHYTTPAGEKITDFFWRSCIDAISAYPILKQPTRFDIGSAQIISLDLDEVAPRGGPEADRQTGVMYMLARHVVGSHFFMMPADVDYAPQLYKEHHSQRIKTLRQDPKRLCYDELHRVARNGSVAKQLVGDLETSARESRKWNLHIGLYSQSVEDIPNIILELATSIFILGTGTKKAVDQMGERLGLNQTTHNAIMNLRKPGKQGASMVALFRTGEGLSTQLLTNTIGMQALWAFSSTTEDVQVRNELYDKIGVDSTLKILSKLYPGGVKSEVEKRKEQIGELSATEISTDIIDVLVNEILNKA
jgi:intracellular multiplication protein IcmB